MIKYPFPPPSNLSSSQLSSIMAAETDTPSLSLTNIISPYPVLVTLSSWLSRVDLFNLSLTNRSHLECILASSSVFKTLCRHSLCDGRGLAGHRQYYGECAIRIAKPVEKYAAESRSRQCFERWDNSIIERLSHFENAVCDEAGPLPCIKCDVNICNVCRYCKPHQLKLCSWLWAALTDTAPKTPPRNKAARRPHYDSEDDPRNIFFLCPTCEVSAEKELAGKFPNELCDCDVVERWVCRPCQQDESKWTKNYYKEHTRTDDPETETKFIWGIILNYNVWPSTRPIPAFL